MANQGQQRSVLGRNNYPGGTGKTATNQTPQETGDRWTT